jgi:hypothetical protein
MTAINASIFLGSRVRVRGLQNLPIIVGAPKAFWPDRGNCASRLPLEKFQA